MQGDPSAASGWDSRLGLVGFARTNVYLLRKEGGGDGTEKDHRCKCLGSNPGLGSTLFSPWFPNGCSGEGEEECSYGAQLVAESQGPTHRAASPRGPLPCSLAAAGCYQERARQQGHSRTFEFTADDLGPQGLAPELCGLGGSVHSGNEW